MQITAHDAITMLHGLLFGALLLLSYSGGAMVLYATSASGSAWTATGAQYRLICGYFILMAALAWVTVLFGAYGIYPWYRALPPAGTTDLSTYPQRLLLSSPTTAGWHSLGMEWKEHIAWFAPISLTALARLYAVYGGRLRQRSGLRQAAFGLLALAFFATCVAGFFGAMLNKYAPVRGGHNIVLLQLSGPATTGYGVKVHGKK